MKPIFVNKVRVFGPHDFDQFVSSIDKAYLRRRFLVLFWTGMRYVELQRFHAHSEWWDPARKVIVRREEEKEISTSKVHTPTA